VLVAPAPVIVVLDEFLIVAPTAESIPDVPLSSTQLMAAPTSAFAVSLGV
jgi:hypothetical protein